MSKRSSVGGLARWRPRESHFAAIALSSEVADRHRKIQRWGLWRAGRPTSAQDGNDDQAGCIETVGRAHGSAQATRWQLQSGTPLVTIRLNKLVAALMCSFVASASGIAQSQPDSRLKEKLALVEPRGFVMVNGENIKDLQALFPGDKVRTGENGRAILELRLATVTLAAKSCATYQTSSR